MDRHYPVVEGRVHTRSLEAHIVDHCNLTCADCCSLSPLLPPWFADPASLAADLTMAGRVLRPRVFKLVGGEPLLHPQLQDIIDLVRASGMTSRVSLTTNGIKLGEMSDSFWRSIDAVTISRYPKPGLAPALVAHIQAQAEQFDVALNWKVQDHFSAMTRDRATDDAATTQRIYEDCWIRERCHMIRNGVFYTCTRPAHFQTAYGDTRDFSSDGLTLHHGSSMLLDMTSYLARTEPLSACFDCYGGNAPLKPHRIMKRGEVAMLKAVYR